MNLTKSQVSLKLSKPFLAAAFLAAVVVWWLAPPSGLLFARTRAPLPPQAQQAQAQRYAPAEVISASDVQFPLQSPADDIVVFEVSINARGDVAGMNLLRDAPLLAGAAETSLRTWKFKPAMVNGAPQDSKMLVAFAFKHAVKMASPPAFAPIFPTKESDTQSGWTMPGILSATFAEYPASTIASGATVLQLSLDSSGAVADVATIRDLPGDFIALAARAAKQWEFQPGMLDGRPIDSKIAVAFVFSSRALNPF